MHRGLITLAQAESAAAVAALLTANPTLARGGAYDADDWELSFSIAQGLVDEKETATAEHFVALLLSRSDAGRNAPVSVLFELYFLASQLAADRDDTRVAVRRLRSLRTILTRRVGPDAAELELIDRALSQRIGHFSLAGGLDFTEKPYFKALARDDDCVKLPASVLKRRTPDRQSKLREVFYVTHRARTDFNDAARFYSGARGELQFGIATVWTPASPQLAKLPGPSMWRIRFRSKTSQAASLAELSPIDDENSFYSAINAALTASQKRELFMFVHGFNVSFRGGVERTARLAEDLDLDGPAVLYSWPSQASMISYLVDRNNVIRPFVEDLARFLTELHRRCNPSSVLVVAHSMGNQFMLSALEKAQRDISDSDTTTEIVFASPDVDRADFEAGVKAIAGGSKRQTLYASRRDRALQLSARLQSYQRAGDASVPVIVSSLETIDTTYASGGLIGHIDFAGTALDDFRALSWFHLPPSKRSLLGPAESASGAYWRMHNLSRIAEEAAAFALALVVTRRLRDEAANYVEDLLRNTRRWDRKLKARGKRLAEIVAEIMPPAG